MGIQRNYQYLTGRSLRDSAVLDYGAGWGRLTRMILQFVPEINVYACDADPKSVALFNSLGFKTRCVQVPTCPESLPFADEQFDLIWLWSVLTHLPAKATDAVMKSLHRILKPGGLLLITIRPIEFWRDNPLVSHKSEAELMVEEHKNNGFAHLAESPHWGDTTMSLEFIERTWPQWEVIKTEDDKDHQVKVYLKRN